MVDYIKLEPSTHFSFPVVTMSFTILIDIGSGTSVDYMYAAHGIPLSYTFEFRDQGTYGFVLPPDQIIPNCEETTDAIIGMVAAARERNQF